ncbi:MAG: hypothetical protein ACI8SJ_000063 [Shewanella sp.]|jgi:hypothetical protein
MSEKVGSISIEQWQQFDKALAYYARAEDWEKLVVVNKKMCDALIKSGKPSSRSQLLARQSLAQTHEKIMLQLQQAQAKIKQEMAQFGQQQDGLAAYNLTCVSAGVTND